MDSFKLLHFKLSAEDFEPISPINCQPFVWDTETDEAHQMPEVEKWFKKALNLPGGFHVKDVHTQIKERHLISSNITLRGGTDISIKISANDCVWIETKKKMEDFKEGQAIGKLFIVDNISVTKSMYVLTDCNDNWIIYFFMKTENHQYLASSKINDRSITLAIIREFALDEGKFIHSEIGRLVTYEANLPEPLKRKAIMDEPIPVEVDDRMADLIDDMTEKELFNMSMRKRLRLAKSFVKREEHPIIDEYIRQFSDDYDPPHH
ncbi:678_t:CDS:2 [Acaulospora morrowiae]|uniref:678_t:CDS:1 n=1 Tax=Acaulospora morrowiae TaxID=94023 RepID=A0A9N9CDE2_9GLOM|nr:678_t:CDS:2 [Acaulospora morrowiae]